MVDINKLAWISYFREFKWQRIKKQWKEIISGSIIYLYVLTTFPAVFMDLKDKEYFLYLLAAIPMVWTAWSMMYSSVRLPKLMFMGPMSEMDRRRYLMSIWNIRFWFPNVLLIMVVVVRAILQPETWLFGILIIVQNLLMSCGTVYAGITTGTNMAELKGIGIFIIQMFLGLFAEMILLYYYASERDSLMERMMITWGILLAIQLLLVKKLLPYKKKLFDVMADFENIDRNQEKKGVRAV